MLTKTDKEVILAYARNNGARNKTAEELHYYKGSVTYHLKRIHEKSGLDPHSPEDLAKLVEMAHQKEEGQMTPKCCRSCPHLDFRGGCSGFRVCAKWRAWFSVQWSRIRRAAALTADQKALRQQKLDEIRKQGETKGGR